jgi:hypothetical protein
MHFDSVVGATDWRDGSIASVLRATADAQAAENGDATDGVPTMSFKSLRYIKGLLFRMIKNLGVSPDQAAPALTFCIPANSSSSTDDKGAKWSCTINRKEGNYVVASAAANGLAYLPVKKGNAFELHRLQHFTSPATEPSVSLVAWWSTFVQRASQTPPRTWRTLSSPSPSQPQPHRCSTNR